jgi:hypothetical protein
VAIRGRDALMRATAPSVAIWIDCYLAVKFITLLHGPLPFKFAA